MTVNDWICINTQRSLLLKIVRLQILRILIASFSIKIASLSHWIVACPVFHIVVHIHRYVLFGDVAFVVLASFADFLFALFPVQLSLSCPLALLLVCKICVAVQVWAFLVIFGEISLCLRLYSIIVDNTKILVVIKIVEQVLYFLRHPSVCKTSRPQFFVKTKQYKHSRQSLIQNPQNDRSNDPWQQKDDDPSNGCSSFKSLLFPNDCSSKQSRGQDAKN